MSINDFERCTPSELQQYGKRGRKAGKVGKEGVELILSVFSKNAVYIVRMNRVDTRKNEEEYGCG